MWWCWWCYAVFTVVWCFQKVLQRRTICWLAARGPQNANNASASTERERERESIRTHNCCVLLVVHEKLLECSNSNTISYVPLFFLFFFLSFRFFFFLLTHCCCWNWLAIGFSFHWASGECDRSNRVEDDDTLCTGPFALSPSSSPLHCSTTTSRSSSKETLDSRGGTKRFLYRPLFFPLCEVTCRAERDWQPDWGIYIHTYT